MTKSKEDLPGRRRISIKDVKAQLDQLTAKLKQYECDSGRCAIKDCTLVQDGLRLSQEVELLRKRIDTLRAENAALKKQVASTRSGESASSACDHES